MEAHMPRKPRIPRKLPISRKLRNAASAVAVLLPLVGVGAWHYLSWPGPALADVLAQMGYRELAPPSRLFPPGTISTVETLSNGSRRLHLACTIKEAELAPFWVTSSTIDRSTKWQIENALKASAQGLNAAVSSASGNKVSKVDIALENMLVVTMSHENMIRVRRDYLKDECEQAVVWNLQAGAAVCQVAEVLQADVAYRMSGVEGIDFRQKVDLKRQIMTQIEIEPSLMTAGGDEIRGKELFFGVRVNLYCFRLKDDHRIVGTIAPNRL
jgi:hypothetical protein